jgi:hypothetical protein
VHATIRLGFNSMDTLARTDLYHGLFTWHPPTAGPARLTPHDGAPRTVPDPHSGRALKIAHIEVATHAICPACEERAPGAFVSFVADLRLAYACPGCRTLVWLRGA